MIVVLNTVCGSGLPGRMTLTVSGAVEGDWNSSDTLGARMSREDEARKRMSSFTCQTMPAFQVVVSPLRL